MGEGSMSASAFRHTRNAKNRNPKKVTNIATPEPQATNSGNIPGVAERPTEGAITMQSA